MISVPHGEGEEVERYVVYFAFSCLAVTKVVKLN